jgi:hypothetical protein
MFFKNSKRMLLSHPIHCPVFDLEKEQKLASIALRPIVKANDALSGDLMKPLE